MTEQKWNIKIRLPNGWKLNSETLKYILERDTIMTVDSAEEIKL